MTRRKPRGQSGRNAGGDGRPDVLYGWHSALAALANPERVVRRVLASEAAAERLAGLGVLKAPVTPSEPRALDHAAGPDAVHQGIVVLADPLPEPDLSDLSEARILVVLDQVTDPHNVGAILRTAAAFGADALVLTERHGPAASGALAKAASGAVEHVPVVRVKNLARAMEQIADMGLERIGLDSEHAEPIESVAPGGRMAIVLGAEGKGLRRLTREACDRLVRIKTSGPIASLNVSNAAAVALYALTRPRP
jgi:23S rRNA (guanosine2251-2'-O)-methyltransferase